MYRQLSELAGQYLCRAQRHVQILSIVSWSSIWLDERLTCTPGTDTLPAPPPGSTLQYLAVGRGTITYTCDGRSDVQMPLYVTQQAFLYNAAALVPKFSSEEQFHSYIPRFLDYDYTSIDNSSLTCIGNVQRADSFTIFDIYGVDAYSVRVKETVTSPDHLPFDISWAHSQDDDKEWDIYRVETAGGGPPYNCGDQVISDEIPVEYAAEYWFYRRNVKQK